MIKARIKAEEPNANLKSYVKTYGEFSWAEAETQFTWHETGRMNMAFEAIDRWARDPQKQAQKALVVEQGNLVRSFTYGELMELSCQWANLFQEYGLRPGDRLFIYLPPCPETYVAILASARLGMIFSPLFASLNLPELEVRIQNGNPKAILTHPDLAERLPLETMEGVEHLFYTQGPLPRLSSNEVLVPDLLGRMSKECEPYWVERQSPLYLIYTSGSTGPPKGVVHGHGDMVGHWLTARYVLDLKEQTVLWTDGDPAWVTGTVYSTFAPWLCGATSFVQGNPFSASTWYRTLERHGISVWYTTPMRIRSLMEAGEDLPTRYDFSHLRHISTVGEALLPEAFYWVRKSFGRSPHDTWWMSETGVIALANFPSMDIKPGAMGRPVPGLKAAILDEKGEQLPILSMGELALEIPWPGMMTGIWQDEARYRAYFRHKEWFMTGDMAEMDEEGYFYHHGRMDDLIKVGEMMIGPYEIERILCQHPAVCEVAVISTSRHPAKPQLKAFVTVERSYTASNRLNQEIKAFLKANLSSELPLKEVEFLEALPKTGSGKVLRRVLRAKELGLPGGDTSTMSDE